MPCIFSPKTIDEVIDFHGHFCPGLAIGIRAAEFALTTYRDAPLVAVSETDMCGVDAIQYLTDCTLGKGNFLVHDLGKMAFSFYEKATGDGKRILLKPAVSFTSDARRARELLAKSMDNAASPAEEKELAGLREKQKEFYLQADLDQIFNCMSPQRPMPRPASVLDSLVCEACGENTMESRTRRFKGKTLCIPCFEAVEQKK
jgi:formylmethanofuran dehydrogenase subunit E